jgi:NitT/TauT family transport system substrate-binding protein
MRLVHAPIPTPSRQRIQRLRWVAVATVGVGLASLASGCSPFGKASAATGQTITVAAVPGIDNANLYLAQKKGLFTRAGIHVKILRYTSVSSELGALSNGDVDVAAGDYGDLFSAQANSGNKIYTILADGYDAAPGIMLVMTTADSKLTSPTQLTGHTIAVPETDEVSAPAMAPNSLDVAAATAVLVSDGVNMSLVTWQPMSEAQELSELLAHKIKAALLTEPYVYEAQQAGAVQLADVCSGPTAGIPLSGYFSTRAWSHNKQNAAAVTAFESAISKADAMASMPGPIQSVLPTYAGLTKSQAALVTVGVYPLSTIAANVQRTADLMNLEGMIRYRLNVAAMIVR